MYDVAVCGSGAVGAYLASLFSRKYSTVLIEENAKIGLPIACSGLYSKRLLEFVDMDKDLIENEIRGARIHAGGKTFTFSRGRIEAYVVRRDRLDLALAAQAEKNGCDVLTSTRLVDFSVNGSVNMALSSGGSAKGIESKLLAGCDGPLSTIRKKSMLKGPKEILQGVFCYADECDFSDSVDLWFGDVAPGFFAWRIPRGETVEYGLATRKNANALFKKFLSQQKASVKKMYGGLIPVGPPRRIISNGVFLCGDSAAMTKPFTGGGIIYGFTSAKLAYENIVPGEQITLEAYQQKWESTLMKEINIGLLLKAGYSFPSFVHRILLGILEKRQKKLDMDMPSSIFS
ncbi:MAG: NAD(P)/FAD-dependent oxidoreductase [Candidatus Aenigmarchaeota archaeon]|nr:NAD(P)/FAD-dependent oxidoreductase [Candidatus Aenigmarchaeota archaeon]